MPSKHVAYTFDPLPDGAIACDGAGKILRANAAALKLFEVPAEALCRGRDYQEFLHRYTTTGDEPQRASTLEPWLMSLLIDDEAASRPQEAIRRLLLPSGRMVYVTLCAFPLLDARKQAEGTVFVFHEITHRYQKALHLQRVHQAVSRLTAAIAHLPSQIPIAFPEGPFLLSPPVLFVAQQLVDLIGHVLDCQHVRLGALGPAGRLYYAVGSGFTSEQEQYRREVSGRFLPSDFVDEPVLARLWAGQEVVLPSDRMRLPPGYREDFGTGNLLLVPLFLEQQPVGLLAIAKAGVDSGYTLEEIELVKAVAAETMLVIDCLRCWCEQAEIRARALAQQELSRLINDFLNLASHELNTPLTAIKGNIQLAQRRLATLKRQLAEQPEGVCERLEQLQHPLASATQSTRLEQRIIQDLLDDAHIQSHTLQLHPTRWDLNAQLREAVASQQRAAPERTIVLESLPPEQVVPVLADAERIIRVISSYLANALSSSPADQPVTVQLTAAGAVACVSVHDQGPGISAEEHGHIWERLYRAKGTAVQHELDLSLGLGLYLSRAFIEGHHGSVGVQSDPGCGTTFWFTLPIARSAQV
jgi:signal transduction histidine kinase